MCGFRQLITMANGEEEKPAQYFRAGEVHFCSAPRFFSAALRGERQLFRPFLSLHRLGIQVRGSQAYGSAVCGTSAQPSDFPYDALFNLRRTGGETERKKRKP